MNDHKGQPENSPNNNKNIANLPSERAICNIIKFFPERFSFYLIAVVLYKRKA